MRRQKILVALPASHPPLHSLEDILSGLEPCSGTNGSFVRGASLLGELGHTVTVSGNIAAGAAGLAVIPHSSVVSTDYDLLMVHQSHWQEDAGTYTFGLDAIPKSYLWLQNQGRWRQVDTFFRKGGLGIFCPTDFHANVYRAVRGFRKKVWVVYNTYCRQFVLDESTQPVRGRLLFIGAITPEKGFIELLQAWKELASRGVKAELVIAGSIALHRVASHGSQTGVADESFEKQEILPLLNALPKEYAPTFLGALNPVQLREEIRRSEAVLVNPSWHSWETFCVAAVEAEICGRPVLSVGRAGLLETVYPSRMKTLATEPGPTAFADLVEQALAKPDELRATGIKAAEWAAKKFSPDAIRRQFDQMLQGNSSSVRPSAMGSEPRDWICDVLRITNLAVPFERHLRKR